MAKHDLPRLDIPRNTKLAKLDARISNFASKHPLIFNLPVIVAVAILVVAILCRGHL